MKIYGANKATEFTRKQINVIFAKAKNGQLNVEKWYMTRLYDLAEYYGYDDNGNVEREEGCIKSILECVFESNIEKAQELITENTDKVFNLLSRANREAADRSFI